MENPSGPFSNYFREQPSSEPGMPSMLNTNSGSKGALPSVPKQQSTLKIMMTSQPKICSGPKIRSGVVAFFVFLLSAVAPAASQSIITTMPKEDAKHEGTWLSWPHQYTYGKQYQNDVERTWIQMTRALVGGEKVHIIAYNSYERRRIRNKLARAKVNLNRVDFLIMKTNDAWIRDNGPLFVRDNNGKLKLTDWDFNGWGQDAPYGKDNTVPAGIAMQRKIPRVDLNKVVLEGGAIAVDGRGALIATRSSVLRNKRNPGMSEAQMESYLRKYLGITHTIWLNGSDGGNVDITDTHIDGVVHFANANTIVTMRHADLVYYGLTNNDVDTLYAAKNASGGSYQFKYLPLTARNVKTTWGRDLGYKGSYVNFYIANKVVQLMPSYNDPNDEVARKILQGIYGKSRRVIKIDVRNLYMNGGMVHCVTMQQPVA